MMPDVHVKSNPKLEWQKQHSTRRLFSPANLIYTEVLHRVKEEGNILHTIQGRKANCNGHILDRNCLLKHVTEGTIGEGYMWWEDEEGDVKQLLDDFKETTGYCKLKEEALVCTFWRTCFGKGYRPVVQQTTGLWQPCAHIKEHTAV